MTVRIKLANEAIRRARGVTPEHGAVAERFYSTVESGERPPSPVEIAADLGLDLLATKRIVNEVRHIGQGVLADHR